MASEQAVLLLSIRVGLVLMNIDTSILIRLLHVSCSRVDDLFRSDAVDAIRLHQE